MSSGHTFNPKIALLGAGNIGGTLALFAGLKKLSSNIVLLDIVEGVAEGKSLDLSQAFTCEGLSSRAIGTADITENSHELEGADVVVVTAGFPRKPGMSRDDLLSKNAEVITGVAKAIKARCPKAFVVCITNPLDVMVSLLQKVSGLPASHVVGMAGMLDSSRFRYFLAKELGVSQRDVSTMVLGGHGDDMVPLQSVTSVNGIPLNTVIQMGWISQQKVDEIIQMTRVGGGEIVKLLKLGSAFVAPASCAIAMVEAYLRDEKRVMPCCAQLGGEYGYSGLYAGVPVIIGKGGVERVLQIPLAPKEKENLDKSIKAVQDLRSICANLGFDC